MVTYHFKSGRVVCFSSKDSTYSDPSEVIVTLECDESMQFGSFVYDAAIRWKIGETAVFHELLALLLPQMVGGRLRQEGDARDRGQVDDEAGTDDAEDNEEEKQYDEVSDTDGQHQQGVEESLVKLEAAVKFETPGGC